MDDARPVKRRRRRGKRGSRKKKTSSASSSGPAGHAVVKPNASASTEPKKPVVSNPKDNKSTECKKPALEWSLWSQSVRNPSRTHTRRNQKKTSSSKLDGAAFRWINEKLYTSPSDTAVAYFAEAPDMFEKYHAGFRQQVSSWPVNPVDSITQCILHGSRGLNSTSPPKPGGDGKSACDDCAAAVGSCVRKRSTVCVGDFGCGDGGLGLALASHAGSPHFEVTCLDLQCSQTLKTALKDQGWNVGSKKGSSGNEKGVLSTTYTHPDHPGNAVATMECDMRATGLPSASLDIAVFSLALMGTNWPQFLQEAVRCLRPGGLVMIAEVESRFYKSAHTEQDEKEGSADGGGSSVDAFVRVCSQTGLSLQHSHTDLAFFYLFVFRKQKEPKSGVTGRKRGRSGLHETDDPELERSRAIQAARGVMKPCVYKKR